MNMQKLIESVRLSDKLTEARRCVKFLLGDQYHQTLQEYKELIILGMRQHNTDNPLIAVLRVIEQADKDLGPNEYRTLNFLAAAVEMVEPSK